MARTELKEKGAAETAVAVVAPKGQKAVQQTVLGSAMKAGFIARGEAEAARMQIQNHLWIKEMIESGEYKKLVEEAQSINMIEGLEPREAFLKLAGTNHSTYAEREKQLQALGVETLQHLRGVGVSWKEIRILADSGPEVKREVKALASADMPSAELADALANKIADVMEARDKAKERAFTAECEREKAVAQAKRNAQKVVEKDEHVKKLESELRDARKGLRSKDEKECQMMVEAFEKLWGQAIAQLHGVDFDHSPRTRALLLQSIGRMETTIKVLRAEYLNVMEETEA